MMNNFTPRAQQVLALARKEAERFNHNYVGTEHLLLGLIKLGQGVAVNVLEKMGLDLERVRMEVEKHVGSHPETNMIGNIPYTPRVKKVLALAGKEAQALNHSRRHAPGPVDLVACPHQRRRRHPHPVHHIIDIAPTILEAASIEAPEMVDGIRQKPIEGVSMVYTFDKANATTPSTRKTQHLFG